MKLLSWDFGSGIHLLEWCVSQLGQSLFITLHKLFILLIVHIYLLLLCIYLLFLLFVVHKLFLLPPSVLNFEIYDNELKKKIKIVPPFTDDGAVTLYRVGHCVDMSRGPMMAHTGLLGKVAVVAAHQLGEHLHRVQGVALPSDILVSFFFSFYMVQRVFCIC